MKPRSCWSASLRTPKNTTIIAKAVSAFGILVYWHETSNLARVVVKVYLKDDAKIPDSVKVNAGLL